jgi:predicted DNA-binding transcriptional regulator AlpA
MKHPGNEPRPEPLQPGDRIVSEREAAQIRNVSPDTLRRLAARGEGPRRIKLSPRRVGYRLSEVLSI